MARPKVQFCRWGHDTFIVGRRKSGMCAECDSNRVTVWRWSNSAFRAKDNARRLKSKKDRKSNSNLEHDFPAN